MICAGPSQAKGTATLVQAGTAWQWRSDVQCKD
jgi:hypothetical protein